MPVRKLMTPAADHLHCYRIVDCAPLENAAGNFKPYS